MVWMVRSCCLIASSLVASCATSQADRAHPGVGHGARTSAGQVDGAAPAQTVTPPPTPESAAEKPRSASAEETASEVTSELFKVVAAQRSLYLATTDGCEEWQAAETANSVVLTRTYYTPDLPGERARRRYRETRIVGRSRAGLALQGTRIWVMEEFDRNKSTWRESDSVAGGSLCVAEPSIRRVQQGLHYAIGGGDVYFSRRSCEEGRAQRDRAHPSC